MAFTIFLNGFSLVQLFATFGAMVQDNITPLSMFQGDMYTTVLSFISLAFYIVVITVAFYAYREFKALSFENGGAFGGNTLLGGGGTYLPTSSQAGYGNTMYI